MPPSGSDSTGDVQSGTTWTVEQLNNPATANRPANEAEVVVHENLVALSTVLVSMNSSGTQCEFSAWVGPSAGGAYAGMEVFQEVMPNMGDGGAT